MKVIVCGAGQVGTGIARQLSLEGNDVTVIDQSSELINRISETLEVKALNGFASHPDVLEQADAGDADMLIAVTVSDEVNMVACQIGHSIFNIPMKIARIRSQHYLHPLWHDLYRKDHLPIDVIISPESEVAHAIMRRLHVPGALNMVPFAEGRLRLVAVKCLDNCPVLGFPLSDVISRAQGLQMAIAGVVRDGKFILPDDVRVFRSGDDVYFVAVEADVRQTMQLFGHNEKEAHRVVILGGGNIGVYLAEMIEADDHGIKAKIIEKDAKRAHEIAEQLRRTTVINGNAMERDILLEANVPGVETLISVTNDDKVNILASLLAKREGCQTVVTLVNNTTYAPLVATLGVDVLVSPRETTVSSILQHVRRGKIRALHSIQDGIAEVMEAEVIETAELAGHCIRDLELPRGINILMLMRGDETIIAQPDTIIQPHDRVMLVSTAGMVKKVEKIFSVSLEYF